MSTPFENMVYISKLFLSESMESMSIEIKVYRTQIFSDFCRFGKSHFSLLFMYLFIKNSNILILKEFKYLK